MSKLNYSKNGDSQFDFKEFLVENILSFRSFLTIIVMGAMINNIDHSADLYKLISEDVTIEKAYFVVIIFDLIVIALIWVGDSKAALFAATVFLINELSWDGISVFYQIYKKAGDVNYTLDKSMEDYLLLIQKGTTMLIYGGIFAYTVHHFSYMIKQEIAKRVRFHKLVKRLRAMVAEEKAESAKGKAKVADLKDSLADEKKTLADLQQRLAKEQQSGLAAEQQLKLNQQRYEDLLAEVEALRAYKEEMQKQLTCVCGEEFDELAKKYGHQRSCEAYRAHKNSDKIVEVNN